ncbi:agmatinase [Desulfobaculum xiamenense]|nr:agmatinase [Desulfobaculum xiamenense]
MADDLEPMAPADCRYHIIPVPYEETVSYGGGTAMGPSAILEASAQLELWDGFSVPARRGVYTQGPVDCTGGPEVVLDRISAAVKTARSHGGMPVVLGGEHTVTLGALRALCEEYGSFGVVQFDAHADLRASYEGSPFSHACVMHRAVADLGLPLFQLGVRALCEDEVAFRRERSIPHIDAWTIGTSPMPETLLPADFPENIYVTFDVDGLDSTVMPATGTPVPGGLTWYQAQRLLRMAIGGRRVIGFDVVELAPIEGLHACDFAAAQLTYSIMGIIEREGRD